MRVCRFQKSTAVSVTFQWCVLTQILLSLMLKAMTSFQDGIFLYLKKLEALGLCLKTVTFSFLQRMSKHLN